MFLARKSKLSRVIDRYSSLFIQREKRNYKDDAIEEITYKNNDMKIVFAEDLREHIVNLFIVILKKRLEKYIIEKFF